MAFNYTPKTWKNGPTGGTPITADELTRIDTGVKLAGDIADTAENASAGSIGGNATTLAPNTWTLLTAAGTSSATVAKYRVDVDAGDAVAYPAGTTLDVDACIIGEQPYFDGDRLPATLPE